MKFDSVTNEKATSKFHVLVQTPAFPCSQKSQGAVVLEMQITQKACRARGLTDKINHFAISEANSSPQEFASP